MRELLNPREFFPILRRWIASASESLHITRTRTSAEVAEWLKEQFPNTHEARMHYLRIERRLRRFPMQLSGAFRLTEAQPIKTRGLGGYLWPHIFGRKRKRWFQR